MPNRAPTPLSAIRAFVTSLIKSSPTLTPWSATPAIKKKFGRGVFFPTLAKWFAELKPGYEPWPKPAKAGKKAAKKAKVAKKAKAIKPEQRPAKKASTRTAGKKGAAAAAPSDRYLVELDGKSAVVAGLAPALAAVNKFLASGKRMGDARVGRIVPVRLGVQVLAE